MTAQPARRQLTELEHDAAWHAIEGAAGEEGADPGTVLTAVLTALGIDPPELDEMAASLRRDGFGDDEITEILRHDDALCGHCGVPKVSHHHPWTSTADTIASAPQHAAVPTP
ncbi:hypothetical protein OHA37_26870 [Streptomyces sp. NBC_00335]|uniref:hypothetical protein n=1 Tax=unclassified Streptomyces TaxID=2593676 RepID=UPI002251B849|nr:MULTISPECIES: hypothetical protein [unclassified Streptomyces]MCX5407473.1 hypothetical protein [Streptomyces sp. NBC_00086]